MSATRPPFATNEHLQELDRLSTLYSLQGNWPWSLWPYLQCQFQYRLDGPRAKEVLWYWLHLREQVPAEMVG